MKGRLRPLVRAAPVALCMVLAGWPLPAQEGGAVVEEADVARAVRAARSMAQSLAASGGYTQRPALWQGVIDSGAARAIELQLFAANDYQVTIGFDPPTAKIAVSASDARGDPLPLDVHRGHGKLVFGIDPARSGTHRIRLSVNDDAARPVAVAFTYVYK